MSATPYPVYLVEPKAPYFQAGKIFAGLILIWPTTWLAMLLMGAVLPDLLGPQWALGYWKAMGLILLIRIILPARHRLTPRARDIEGV